METDVQDTGIAIVGMSGLFPKAPDIGVFWENILNKVDAVDDAPPGWLFEESLVSTTSDEVGRIYTQKGGFLGDVGRFDPKPFGIMPLSTTGAEPDQFLALAAAARALDDAGYAPGRFDPERVGIVLGHGIHIHRANANGIQHVIAVDQTVALLRQLFPKADEGAVARVRRMLVDSLPGLNTDSLPGLVPNMMTGRIANRLNMMGLNYILDAACASSLLAVEAAMNELRLGRADMMLAGGVNTTTSPLVLGVFCRLGALSRQERVLPFDEAADGTLLGEGLGIVVLKRLRDALEAGDRIYAVVRSVGQSSDGQGSGLMAPRLEGEALAIRRAYAESGIDPATIGLIEAHGTGIPLGDRTEVAALRTVFGGRTRAWPSLPIGSIKSMIGHCIPAAGAASLIKCALALHHKVLPPTICDAVSPSIGLEETNFFVNTEARPWLHGRMATPRRAGINAFGFGGVNSHLILEEAPTGGTVGAAFWPTRGRGRATLVVASAESRSALARRLEEIQAAATRPDAPPFEVVARDAWQEAGEGRVRFACPAASVEDLARGVAAVGPFLAGEVESVFTRNGACAGEVSEPGRTAFLFPGENSQYPGMLRDLALEFPVVRAWLDDLNGLFDGEREIPHSILLYAPDNNIDAAAREEIDRTLERVDAGSEAVFFADQALFHLLTSEFRIVPDMLLGHSTGENAALVASGVLTLKKPDVLELIRRMNAVFRDLEESAAIPHGVLVNVGALEQDRMLKVLERHPDAVFTMDNCPNQAIVFTPDETADSLMAALTEAGGLCARLPLSWAYHTPLIAPMAERFRALFSDLERRPSDAVIYSCATARPMPVGSPDRFIDTIIGQYTSRVRFTEAVGHLYEDGARVFIEVGPGANLTAFVKDILRDKPHVAEAVDHRRRGGRAQLLNLLRQVYVHGVPLTLDPLFRGVVDPSDDRAPAAPVLPSELPTIRLDDRQAQTARTLLTGGGGISSSENARAKAGVGVLKQGGVVARRPAVPATDWSGAYRLPIPFRLFAAGRVADPSALLSPRELAVLRGDLRTASEDRRRQWILARVAAKAAVASLRNDAPGFRDISILNDANGRPLVLMGESPGPAVSLSHLSDMAVAACVPEGFQVGVDLERRGRLRNPDDVAARAFTRRELRLLDRIPASHRADGVLLVWSMKEAAAKALGRGLVGAERAFEVVDLTADGRGAVVVFGNERLRLQARPAGAFLCSVAYPAEG